MRGWHMLGQEQDIGTEILSSPFSSSPVKMVSSHMFTNCVGRIHTTLPPEDLLLVLHRTEERCGRRRRQETAGVHADRVIDLDLLLYGSMILAMKSLTLPHPGMVERLFVLAPMAEIDPDLVHPVQHRTMAEMFHDRMAHNAQLKYPDQEQITRRSWQVGRP